MEIHPNELRIGNYVNYFGRVVEVKGVKAYSSQLLYNGGCDDLAFIDGSVLPIPITEEWLFGFGWKYQYRGPGGAIRFYISQNFGKHFEHWFEMNLPNKISSRVFIWLCWDIGGGRNWIHLPEGERLLYVHQLQNLYYPITGKELKCDISKIE